MNKRTLISIDISEEIPSACNCYHNPSTKEVTRPDERKGWFKSQRVSLIHTPAQRCASHFAKLNSVHDSSLSWILLECYEWPFQSWGQVSVSCVVTSPQGRPVRALGWVMHKCIIVKVGGKRNTGKVCKKPVNLLKRGGENL